MEPAIEVRSADPAGAAARQCLAAYYAELAERFPAGFEVSRSRDPLAAEMRAPHGAFLLAWRGGEAVGCVGIKGDDLASGGTTGEVKRLWIAPALRGAGLGSRLMAEAEAAARRLGIGVLRLDTNRALPEAAALYRRTGWHEIARFNDDPYAELFFEKVL